MENNSQPIAPTEEIPPWIKSDAIYPHIWNRTHEQNQDFRLIFVGGTGSGKSYAALRFGIDLDRQSEYPYECRFNLKNIVFTADNFLEFVRDEHPKGTVGIWDEAAIEANSRQWQSLKNQVMSYTAQTCRNRNYILISTCPSMNFVDSQIRQLYHAYIQMNGVSFRKKRSYGNFYWLVYDSKTGETYSKKPRVINENRYATINQVMFSKPNKDWIEAYEAKKREAQEAWYSTFGKQLKLMKDLSDKKLATLSEGNGFDLETAYEAAKSKSEQYLNAKKTRYVVAKLMMGMKLSEKHAVRLAQLLNNDLGSEQLTKIVNE